MQQAGILRRSPWSTTCKICKNIRRYFMYLGIFQPTAPLLGVLCYNAPESRLWKRLSVWLRITGILEIFGKFTASGFEKHGEIGGWFGSQPIFSHLLHRWWPFPSLATQAHHPASWHPETASVIAQKNYTITITIIVWISVFLEKTFRSSFNIFIWFEKDPSTHSQGSIHPRHLAIFQGRK